MERKLEIGMGVVFIDEHYAEHNALITAIHGDPCGDVYRRADQAPEEEEHHWPCVNLVSVDPSEGAQDQYGRQLRRCSSVVHWRESSASGYCWRLCDEAMTGMPAPTVS